MEHRIDTVVVGGGQAGLAVGYHLTQAQVPFVIVDANDRTGDSWRNRWDTLKLFTPNRFNSLPGLPIEGGSWKFPTKDEVADYLESYAEHFDFPILRGTRVEKLSREGDGFRVIAGEDSYLAENVIVAMANFQTAKTPPFADQLSSSTTQIHVAHYKGPHQLQPGPALVVGMGNSGAEVAMDLVGDRDVYVSGSPSAVQPFRPEGLSGRLLMPMAGTVMSRVMTQGTPMGRKFQSKMLHRGGPLLRIRPKDLVAAGVDRVGRVEGVTQGSPRLEDGTVLHVSNVVWCTGFDPGFDWIDLPVFDDKGEVVQRRGVTDEPGLYFVGLKFLYSVLSDTLKEIGRDSGYVVDHLVAHRNAMTAV